MVAQGPTPDRARPAPVRVALCLWLRPPEHRRGDPVSTQRRRHGAARRGSGGLCCGRRRRQGQADRVLVLDNAGWHASNKLMVPEGLRLEFLPPYSPEPQPAERLWPLTNEAVANQSFATLNELDEALGERCRTLATMPDLIKSYTRYSWWPKSPPIVPP